MNELVSTRDPLSRLVTYSDSVLQGLARDRGLYSPARQLDALSMQELRMLETASYPELAAAIKQRFVGDEIPARDIRGMMNRAYDSERFPYAKDGVVTPVRGVQGTDIYIQNLSLGPTAAFKDMAMQTLGQELEYLLEKRDEFLRILAATSGDTGPAAEAALKGLTRVRIAVLSPYEGMSHFQWAQAGAQSGGNVVNISGHAPFDSLQDCVKDIQKLDEFADLGAVNSINWSRITSQIPYYFAGYFEAIKQAGLSIGDEVDFVVPSGNFGNVLAGYYAKQMGLPVRKLIIATNENNVLHTLVQTGIYRNRGSSITSSPSMDIAKASNLERVVFEIFGRNPVMATKFMEEFESRGEAAFANHGIPADIMKTLGFESGSSSHAERIATIAWLHNRNKDIIDPHTADAVTVARRLPQDRVPKICLETALPVKFEPTIREAIGFVPPRLDARFVGLESRVPEGAFTILEDVSVNGLAAILRDKMPRQLAA